MAPGSRWNQPVCDRCWALIRPNREPARLVQAESETCAVCGQDTTSGIYVRMDPSSVAYPAGAFSSQGDDDDHQR
jgi:RNA polymerase subunit RPABC4/transcription elongation factor Spt4